MCHTTVIEFFIETTNPNEFKGKKVLEVGSKYINGSVRPFIERFLKPKKYIGIDIEPGKFVDIVLPAEKVVEYFGREKFDVVIATEVLEHVRNWKLVISNLKEVLKKNGYIYITTRSKGFPYHEHPYDFWRYEIEDMRKIFSDFNIIELKKDPAMPGVFLKAKKPLKWKPSNLLNLSLYSILLGRRTKNVSNTLNASLVRKLILKLYSKRYFLFTPLTF